MKYYLEVLKKYAVFKGRASRKEFWMYLLFNVIFSLPFIILDKAAGTDFGNTNFGVFYLLYFLCFYMPSIAVLIRRLHDTEKSGWLSLLGIIPIFGFIYLFVASLSKGTPGVNKYGPNPERKNSGPNSNKVEEIEINKLKEIIAPKSELIEKIENQKSELRNLYEKEIFTDQEYVEKLKRIENEHKQKEIENIKKEEVVAREKQKIIFEKRLEKKTKPLIDLIISAKNQNLINEHEYLKKENEIIQKCQKEIEYEDSNRPKISDIPNEFFSLFSVENQDKITSMINSIELRDMVVLRYEEVNSTPDNSRIRNMEVHKFKKEQWKKILESHEKEKKHLIIINFQRDNIFIIKDKALLINIFRRKTNNCLTEDEKDSPSMFNHKKEANKDDNFKQISTNDDIRDDVKNKNVDYRGEIEKFTSALRLNPDNSLNYYHRGNALLSLGSFKESIKDFSQSIALDGKNALAYFSRGHAKNNISDHQGAIDDYTKAIEIDPLFAKAYFHRGFANIKIKQKEAACADLDKASELGFLRANDVKMEFCK